MCQIQLGEFCLLDTSITPILPSLSLLSSSFFLDGSVDIIGDNVKVVVDTNQIERQFSSGNEHSLSRLVIAV